MATENPRQVWQDGNRVLEVNITEQGVNMDAYDLSYSRTVPVATLERVADLWWDYVVGEIE